MRLLIITFFVLLQSCNAQEKDHVIFKISDYKTKKNQQTQRKKLTEELWRTLGFFNIEKYNADFDYYITDTTDSLKIIERVYDSENYIWLCLVNKKNYYEDHVEVAYDNAEGFLTVTSVMKNNTVIVKTWNDFSEIKQSIDTIKITKNSFRNPVKERLVQGVWKNETSNLSFKLFFKENQLHYTFTSPKRTFSNTAEITQNNLIIFKGFEWSEYAGGAIDNGESEEEKEDPPLPTKIGATINFESNEFVIQNYGNAMNYYTKIEEASEKYVTFKRLKQ